MNYKNYNDYELIYHVREQNDDSYGILFQKYIPIIKRITSDAYMKFSSYGYDLDYFIQEGYLGFQQALSSFDETKNSLFYTYASMCIQRKIISFCKKISSVEKNISNHYYVSYEDTPIIDPSPGMEEVLVNQEFYRGLWEIVYTFPLEYTCVFELRMNQFPYQEISQLLDIPVRKAEFMIYRIYRKIRREFCWKD